MAMIEVKCPMCRQTDVVKHGVDAKGVGARNGANTPLRNFEQYNYMKLNNFIELLQYCSGRCFNSVDDPKRICKISSF
jgi:sarcosine oxidase delta subunit